MESCGDLGHAIWQKARTSGILHPLFTFLLLVTVVIQQVFLSKHWSSNGRGVQGEKIAQLENGPPVLAARKGERRLYFDRDLAGLCNVRLQFESLVAVAALTGRRLVLPQPDQLAHLPDTYHEGHFWSIPALQRWVSLDFSPSFGPPANAYKLTRPLVEVRLADLPEDEDWFVGTDVSRLAHFECLNLTDEQEKEVGAMAVLEGLDLADHHYAAAKRTLRRLGLKRGRYDAVHLRRGDFKGFTSADWWKSGKEIAESLHLVNTSDLPVLVATDSEPGDNVVQELTEAVRPKRVVDSRSAEVPGGMLAKAAVDLILMSWAKVFYGTPQSTFSTFAAELRLKASLRGEKVDAVPRLILDAHPIFRDGAGFNCWNKMTTFEWLHLPAA